MEKQLTVGEILKPQGIRGELKVKPFTDTAEVFRTFKRFFIDGEEYKVLSVRIGDGAVLSGLRGVPDRNAAELMRGKLLVVPREEAPALEEGSYYIADLLGLKIVTEEGEELGILSDIRQAATDIYTLKQGEKEILFPAVKGLVQQIEIEKGVLTVNKKRFLEVAVL